MAAPATSAVTGDYRRDAENFSRQWRIGAELIAHLPAEAGALGGASRGRRRDPRSATARRAESFSALMPKRFIAA